MALPKQLTTNLREQICPTNHPCEFRLTGLCNEGVDIYTSALLVFEKISEWLNEEDLKVSLKRDKFKEIFIQEIKNVNLDSHCYSKLLFELKIRNRIRKSGYLLIEIPPTHATILHTYLKEL